MEYGCIAEHLGHSFSGIIHAKIGGYDYKLCEVAKDDLDSFMREHDFKGINVTIPYKQSVIPYINELDPTAAAIGAVNTIVNRNGKLYGYNTDFRGMRSLIQHEGIDLFGKTVLILGTGGTSKTAVAVAESLGAAKIVVVSRTPCNGVIGYAAAEDEYSGAEVIINTTPCGMFPDNYAEEKPIPIDMTKFYRLEALVDAIFNPLRSKMVIEAKKQGAKSVGGLYMLVAQAVYASEIFRDIKIPEEEITRIYNEIRTEKENIALTGMPACGKTTAAKYIAALTGRELVDIDAEIVKREGCEISEIFSSRGEKAFRDIETEVLKEYCKRGGLVIATGGGAILRDENIDALRQNCKVYFIDRPLERLKPTASRPLLTTWEDIIKRYNERIVRYRETADVIITPSDKPSETAEMIIERHKI